jgi:hypothetical protein
LQRFVRIVLFFDSCIALFIDLDSGPIPPIFELGAVFQRFFLNLSGTSGKSGGNAKRRSIAQSQVSSPQNHKAKISKNHRTCTQLVRRFFSAGKSISVPMSGTETGFRAVRVDGAGEILGSQGFNLGKERQKRLLHGYVPTRCARNSLIAF